ncbi:MAG: energy transducer TonB, partial [Pseudomonadota bacterium]
KPKPKPEPEPQPQTEPKPEPEPEPEPKPEPEPTPEPVEYNAVTAPKTAEQVEHETGNNVATPATGSGNRVEAGGNPGARKGYLTKLLKKLARAKRYPRSARRAGVEGVATIAFRVTRDGDALNVVLVSGSGDERLDRAALELLERAKPLPRFPKDMAEDALDLRLPIEYSLKKSRR